MNNADFKTFEDIMTKTWVMTAHQEKELSPMKTAGYFEALQIYDIETVKVAFLGCTRTETFFPAIAKICELIEGNQKDNIDIEFENAKSMIRDLGFYDSVCLKNKALMCAINDMGGLQEFYESLNTNETETYFKFCRIMKRRLKDHAEGYLPEFKSLCGYSELMANQNAGGGVYNVVLWDRAKVKTLKMADGRAQEHFKLIESTKKAIGWKAPEYEQLEMIPASSMDDVLKVISEGVKQI
jgi:hypothetical protein